MGQYASGTQVSSYKSREEIERTLTRYGASEFAYGVTPGRAQIRFRINDVAVRMTLPLPDRNDRAFTHHSRGIRTASAADEAYEQAVRQKWRALALVVKAKLEAVESKISTIEEEFYAHIELPSGRTVFEETAAAVSTAITTGGRLELTAGTRA